MTGSIPSVGPQELTNRTARLTILYVAALSTVALLSIVGQFLVQWSLSRQTSDSAVVNIAGRQRMLSQKLAKAAIGYQHSSSPAERQQRTDEIRSTLSLWRRSHEGLQRGNQTLNLPGRNSAAVDQLFAQVEPAYQAIQSAAEQLLDDDLVRPRSSEEISSSVAAILVNENEFLSGMDSIVAQYEREARGRVGRLQTIEWILLALTLVTLISEGVLVFRPAVKHVRLAASEVLSSRQQLVVAKEAAESANQQKTHFLANISHELRNPLHAVLGNLELLNRTQLDTRQRNYVATADDSARSLEQLLSDLLDLSRIESGHLAIKTAPFSLRELVERCVAMHRSQAEAKGLQLRSELVDADIWLKGDSLRLRQILINLLGNALKFTEQGEVSLRTVGLPCGESTPAVASIRFEVSDTGIGIPIDQQEGIFQAFVQVDASARREHGGTGLGLAIVSRLLALMNGKCGVTSQPGRGSTFWVELPLEHADAPSETCRCDAEGLGGTAGRSSRLRVLVVEDDEVNRQMVMESLAILGHHSQSAADGPAAIALALEQPFDAVLLDLHLPLVDGYEVARQIRRFERSKLRSVIIALSAVSELSQAESPERLFDRVLTKPAGLRQIEAALTQAVPGKAPVVGCSAAHNLNTSSSPPPKSAGPNEDRWVAVLERLQNRQELFCSLANLFIDGLPTQFEELESALADRRFEVLARAAHTLRGQAVLFAADELAAELLQMERQAGQTDFDGCRRHLHTSLQKALFLRDELKSVLPHMAATTVNAG